MYTYPLHFANHPLEDLVGTDVTETDPPYDYETRDGSTRIDVLEFKRRARGLGLTIYPLGMSVGPTLGLRGSIEGLPDIRINFDGPGSLDSYRFTDAVAYDVGPESSSPTARLVGVWAAMPSSPAVLARSRAISPAAAATLPRVEAVFSRDPWASRSR